MSSNSNVLCVRLLWYLLSFVNSMKCIWLVLEDNYDFHRNTRERNLLSKIKNSLYVCRVKIGSLSLLNGCYILSGVMRFILTWQINKINVWYSVKTRKLSWDRCIACVGLIKMCAELYCGQFFNRSFLKVQKAIRSCSQGGCRVGRLWEWEVDGTGPESNPVAGCYRPSTFGFLLLNLF
jgi:hypothetical protein